MEFRAFTTELTKLSAAVMSPDEGEVQKITKQKVLRGLAAASAAAIGGGLGYGAGVVTLRKLHPLLEANPAIKPMVLAGAAGLGLAAGFGANAARRRFFGYIDHVPQPQTRRPDDRLHQELPA